MSLTEQYALDLYRAAQRGEPAPPASGPHDWRTLREYRDFRAVPAGRPVRRHGRLTDSPRAVRAIREVFARRRSAVPRREPTDPCEEGVDRGRDVVGRPFQCG